MTQTDLIALLPLLLMTVTSLAVMLGAAFFRNHRLTVALTLAGLLATFASLATAGSVVPRPLPPLLVVDAYALFFMGLIVLATAAVVVLMFGYLEKTWCNREESYLLLLVACLGSMVLVCSANFISFFLGLEILSISLYTLIAYLYFRTATIEAGVKYLLLAAASSAFLLFGMALVYAELGTLEFAGTAAALSSLATARVPLVSVGLTLMITGIGFKLAVVPFHLWTPDVYQGAPAPVTAFVATVSKGGVFALLLRFLGGEVHEQGILFATFAIIAIASMLVGNFLALLQNNVKRILAYSSIAHMGYLLVALLAGGAEGVHASIFYLIAYFVTTLGAFGIVTVMSNGDREADSLDDYRGLFWRRPLLAGIFTAMLLSLAGIPLTGGFLGKFYIVAAGASAEIWTLILVLVVGSALGLFYYLRILVNLYATPLDGEAVPSCVPPSPPGARWTLAILTVLLVWLGVYPSPVLEAIRKAAQSLS